MTVKQFFKSVTFKCIVTLLCVLLVSGIFLTIMNGLLKVTDEEKFARAINKIYGKSVTTEKIIDTAENYDSYSIDEAYKVLDDGNYLIKATGKGGFENGTVTCWIVVVVRNGAVSGIDKVLIDSNEKQSYIGNISDKFLNGFKENFVEGVPFNVNVGFVKTGATFSGGAICRAVNGAVDFVNAKFGNVKEDIFKDALYTDYIDTSLSTAEFDEATGNVVFKLVTTGATYKGANNMAGSFTIEIVVDGMGVIQKYNILINGSTSNTFKDKMLPEILDGSLFVGKNIDGILAILDSGIAYPGDGKDTSISTGATQSNHQCIYAAAFAAENYKLLNDLEVVDVSLEGCEYTTYIDTDATTVQYNKKTGAVVFNVVTTDSSAYNGRAQSFTTKIVVDSTGVITSYEIIKNGSTADRYVEKMLPEILDGSLFVGKDIEGILSILDGSVEYPGNNAESAIKSGASQSNHLCLYAAAFAAANYNIVSDSAKVDIPFDECEYTAYIDKEKTTAELNKKTGTVTYEVVTTDSSAYNGRAQSFTTKIVVDSTGVITSYKILVNGSTADRYVERMLPEILDGSLFIGKDIEGILSILDGSVEYPGNNAESAIKSGASQSNHLCLYAAAFAAENYKLVGGQA